MPITTPNNTIVLIDPVTDWIHVVKAALALNYTIISLQLPDVALPSKFKSFLPTSDALKAEGVTHTLSMKQYDTFASVQQIQILAMEYSLNILGVIPLSEIAVEVSDVMASCLGVPYNSLELVTARRDKGLMKCAVEKTGLRVAKYARVSSLDDIRDALQQMSISYPIVVKTPAGMSTTDVFICSCEEEASDALDKILGETSPDGRLISKALLEEYIGGTEFAVNIMTFQIKDEEDGTSRYLVSDMWRYSKTKQARYDSAEICNPADHPELISYAIDVARAVGVRYGAAHVELKALEGDDGKCINPVMIEIGARLSGGRKTIMASEAIESWDPFTSLIHSHCGGSCRLPLDTTYFSPSKFVRHIFLPIEKSGQVTNIQIDIASLTTLHSSAFTVHVGDLVSETSDIVSCAGFVWLVGEKDQVDNDTSTVRASYSLQVVGQSMCKS